MKSKIFDPVRKKLVCATPEEHVRQKVISWLHNELNYPLHRMECEAPLKRFHNDENGRIDLAVTTANPAKICELFLLVECKAPGIPINEALQMQLERYLRNLEVRFVMATNGNDTLFLEKTSDGIVFRDGLPSAKD